VDFHPHVNPRCPVRASAEPLAMAESPVSALFCVSVERLKAWEAARFAPFWLDSPPLGGVGRLVVAGRHGAATDDRAAVAMVARSGEAMRARESR
jgi:hypothetical protein